jgi:hypothetical protein
MIYAVETITHYASEDFDKLLWSAIARWQDQGLEAEVQYSASGRRTGSGTAGSGITQHSALIIARRPVQT